MQFIIKRDSRGHFKFAGLESAIGHKLLGQYGLHENLSTIVLLKNGRTYVKSDAALRISQYLDGAWKLLIVLLVIPRPVRDFFYDIIARNRYTWFGKLESCMLPSREHQARFLDNNQETEKQTYS